MKFGDWLHCACETESGLLCLKPQTPLGRNNYLPSLRHALKYQLLHDTLTSALHDEAILRGNVTSEAPDAF